MPLLPGQEYSEYKDQYVGWQTLINELRACINAAGAVDVTMRAQYEDNWQGLAKAISDLRVAIAALQVAGGGGGDISSALLKANNLSDLNNAGTARANLGLGNAAVRSVGTTAGTVAAGDDSRFGSGGTIPDNSVTFAKIQDIPTNTLIGRASPSDGDPESIVCTPAGQALLDDADVAAQLLTLGIPLVGSLVQCVTTQTGTLATGTTILPTDNTIPQQTEGNQFMSLAITPKSVTNRLFVVVLAQMGTAAAATVTGAIFQDATADAIAVNYGRMENGGGLVVSVRHSQLAGTTSATTFKFRAGIGAAGTITFNGDTSVARFGGKLSSSMTIFEVRE